MKLSLLVSVGKTSGAVIPVTGPQLLIGRDPQCHLRPTSAVISKRHCALSIREGKAYIKDFESTNGTLVNEQRIVGEQELHNDDTLKIGPLEFVVRLEAPTPVDRPTPPPKMKSSDDEEIAAMLLAMQDEGGVAAAFQEVPEGSTVLDMPAVALPEAVGAAANGQEKSNGKKTEANTATAAEAILAKYSRRNRK